MKFLQNVISHFTRVATSQEEKGLKKYGEPLNPFNTDPETGEDYDWLEMAEEELVDGYKYLRAEKERRDSVLSVAINDLTLIASELKERNPAQSDMIILTAYRLRRLTSGA